MGMSGAAKPSGQISNENGRFVAGMKPCGISARTAKATSITAALETRTDPEDRRLNIRR